MLGLRIALLVFAVGLHSSAAAGPPAGPKVQTKKKAAKKKRPTKPPQDPPPPVSAPAPDAPGELLCCVQCKKGQKPCGDACVPAEAKCTQPEGCACSAAKDPWYAKELWYQIHRKIREAAKRNRGAATPCCKVCRKSKPCGDSCIAHTLKCHVPMGIDNCACVPEDLED